jgi:hypothetical protein
VKKNPFEPWQDANQYRRIDLLRDYLKNIKTRRMSFKYITDLAEEAAKHIALKEGAPCNRATLLRNPKYKGLLLAHMTEQVSVGTTAIQRENIKDPAAKALLDTADLTIENLKRENERLKNYIGSLANNEAQGQNLPKVSGPNVSAKATTDLTADRLRFLSTCEALRIVLQKFGGILELDLERQRVVDRSEIPQQVLIDSKIGGPFFEWLSKSSNI